MSDGWCKPDRARSEEFCGLRGEGHALGDVGLHTKKVWEQDMKKERESLAGETLRVHMTRATSLQENLRQNETKSQGSSKSPKLQGHSGENVLTISLGII